MSFKKEQNLQVDFKLVFSMGEANGGDTKRWITIYPIYINAKKTIAEGRRVSESKAVDNPTAQEIAEVCTFLGLKTFIEVKFKQE